jgi:hypothetical protein
MWYICKKVNSRLYSRNYAVVHFPPSHPQPKKKKIISILILISIPGNNLTLNVAV